MATRFKRVASDTAIYGLSSIVGKFLNYLLVPLYTNVLKANSGQYGIVNNIMAYVAIALVIITFGMETTFFRFANKKGEDPKLVFSTALRMVIGGAAVFLALVFIFLKPLCAGMGYVAHPSYVWVMAIVVSIDAVQSILFAYLRYQKRPIRFASLKLLFIVMNIGLNLMFFCVLPKIYASHPHLSQVIYDPSIQVGYIFYVNLFCSIFVSFFMLREFKGGGYGFDRRLMKEMLGYTWPILLLGIAGILDQNVDKILFPKVYPGDGNVELGIYGAGCKIAMLMAMITQAFRYAYEPQAFSEDKEEFHPEFYAKGMKYFFIVSLFAFLAVMAYLNSLRYLIGRGYWAGLRVVPIVMAAQIILGVYYNLSFWYKLEGKTIWGAVFSFVGCALLVIINIIFIPRFGYMSCAWAGVIAYSVATCLSYVSGQNRKRNPGHHVDYPIKEMLFYLLLAVVLFIPIYFSNRYLPWLWCTAVNTVLVGIYGFVLFKWGIPLTSLPYVGRYFEKSEEGRARRKKLSRILLILLAVLSILAVVYCNLRITSYAKSRVYDDIDDVPHRHAALVLGTSPKVPGGGVNKYFTYRIDACVKLYEAGKVDRIIVSGDNRRRTYNEPEEMRKALVARGIPNGNIFLDYAGFRTLDSIVRASEVFGQSSYIIVSQRFHNERGVFIAGKKGIDAIGYNARDARIRYGFKTRLREILARCKVFLDLAVNKQPHFLGEPVDIN